MVHSLHINRGVALFSPTLPTHACNLLFIVTIALQTGHSALPTATIRTIARPEVLSHAFSFLFFFCNIHIITRHSASIHGIFFLRQPEPPLLSRYGYLLLVVGQNHCHCNQISLRSIPEWFIIVCIISELLAEVPFGLRQAASEFLSGRSILTCDV